MQAPQTQNSVGHGKTVAKLSLMVVGMFVFAVGILPPLYDLLCDLTGLNGKVGDQYTYQPAEIQPDTSRLIKVNFVTNTQDVPWKFWSEKGGLRVHPGELKHVNFYVTNTTDKVMVGQAVPSVVPFSATEHFHKTECFCFEKQILQPGETMEMPMRFIVGKELPGIVQSINLSYALFDVTEFTDPSEIAALSETREPGANAPRG